MKNILLSVLSVSLLFFSCKNDDDSTNENQSNSLVGTWEVVQVFIGNGIDSTDQCYLMGTAEFMINGRFDERLYAEFRESADTASECRVFPLVGDFSIDGDVLKQEFDNGNDDRIIRFKIVKDTLKYITVNGTPSFVFVKK